MAAVEKGSSMLGKAGEGSLFSSSLGAEDFFLFHTKASIAVCALLFCESHQKVIKN